MFAFVWLPRDELTTRRRVAIGEMIEQAAQGQISNWSVELGDGDLALIRYTLNVDAEARRRPTSRRSTAGSTRWCAAGSRAVEEALGELVGPQRATRLAHHLSRPISPKAIGSAPAAAEAARDIVCALPGSTAPAQRDVRLFRRDERRPETGSSLKTYRLGDDHPAVRRGAGVREFRLPRARGDADPARPSGATRLRPRIRLCRCRAAATPRPVLRARRAGRAGDRRGARRQGRERPVQPADRRRRRSTPREVVPVPRLVPLSAPGRPVLFAWSPWSTRCAARPTSTTGLIALFDALHDPDARRRPRDEAVEAGRRSDRRRPRQRRGDRRGPHPAPDPRRRRRDPAHQRLRARRARRRSPSSSIQRAGARACRRRCRGARSGSIRRGVEGIHLRGGPIARGGLRWSDRRDDFRTEMLGLMKAQLVKNAVIVPTGAKGGFYPKQLPPRRRPRRLARRRAPKATASSSAPCCRSPTISSATRSSIPRASSSATATTPISSSPPTRARRPSPTSPTRSPIERGFWLGDAFASGG